MIDYEPASLPSIRQTSMIDAQTHHAVSGIPLFERMNTEPRFSLLLLASLVLTALCINSASAFSFQNHRSRESKFSQSLLFSKWDDLVDEDDGPPVAPNMRYIPRNVGRQHENFVAIREAGGAELTNDVYVREGKTEVFWYVGKVARVSDVPVEVAVAKQWPIIEMHAANLRPIELFPSRGHLEIWVAPGDTELEVAYNRPELVFQKIERTIEGLTSFRASTMGFQGEVYEGGFEGFRTWRNNDGTPARPEIKQPQSNGGEELRNPTEEELKEIAEKLKGQDINAIYEEQQRREGKET